jgi:hypothetical protein
MFKGTGSRERIQINFIKNAYQFLNYLNAVLMSYCLHHFPRG